MIDKDHVLVWVEKDGWTRTIVVMWGPPHAEDCRQLRKLELPFRCHPESVIYFALEAPKP